MTKRSTAAIHCLRPWLSVVRKIQLARSSAGMERTWWRPLSRITDVPSGQNRTANLAALVKSGDRARNAPDDHLDRGALAGAAGSDVPQDLAGADGEADVIDGGDAVKALGEVAHFEHRSK